MVERAFGSLRGVIDELLAGEAERPERQTGDDIFESDTKGLLGLLLKFKEEAAVEGGGRYATIRVHQGHRQATLEPRLDTLTLVSIDTWTLLDTFGHYRHVRH